MIEKKYENSCITSTSIFRIYTDGDGARIVIYEFLVDRTKYNSVCQITRTREKEVKDTIQIQYICNNPKDSRLYFGDD